MSTPPPPPPPGVGPTPPAGYANNDEKTWVLLTHFGGAGGAFLLSGVGGWIMPLIALIAKGNQSPTVRAHAVQALNFQLTWTIVGVLGWATVCVIVGGLGILAAVLMGVIFGIIAGVKANEGQLYEYPLSIKMVK
ncbi:MAG TPA: DUF4870 domain-containing protein [Natronosporangium sp.]